MNFDISYAGNVLTLIPTEELSTNTQYDISILKGVSGILPNGSTGIMSSDYTFWFTMTYCPQFTTLNRIKLQVGPLGDTLTDDTIYRMIHKNSMDAIDLYGVSNNATLSYDYFGCDWVDVPILLRRYVECKTAYDVLALLKMTQSMSGGGADQLKSLGDMTIKYGASGTGANAIDPKQIKNLYDCWNEQLRMFRTIKPAVRGFYDASKGYSHPVIAYTTNRVIRPVNPYEGNFTPGTSNWRGI